MSSLSPNLVPDLPPPNIAPPLLELSADSLLASPPSSDVEDDRDMNGIRKRRHVKHLAPPQVTRLGPPPPLEGTELVVSVPEAESLIVDHHHHHHHHHHPQQQHHPQHHPHPQHPQHPQHLPHPQHHPHPQHLQHHQHLPHHHHEVSVASHQDAMDAAAAAAANGVDLGVHLDDLSTPKRKRSRNIRGDTKAFKGVYYNNQTKKYHALMTVSNQLVYLGYFQREEDANSVHQYVKESLEVHYGTNGESPPVQEVKAIVQRWVNDAIAQLDIKSNKRFEPTSSFKGVSCKKKGRIYAQIKVNKVTVHLGYFDNEKDASDVYNYTKQRVKIAYRNTKKADQYPDPAELRNLVRHWADEARAEFQIHSQTRKRQRSPSHDNQVDYDPHHHHPSESLVPLQSNLSDIPPLESLIQ